MCHFRNCQSQFTLSYQQWDNDLLKTSKQLAANARFSLYTELAEHNIWPFTSGRAFPAVPGSLLSWESDFFFFLIYSLLKNYKVHFHCLVVFPEVSSAKTAHRGRKCYWLGAVCACHHHQTWTAQPRLWSGGREGGGEGVSSGGWSRTSGAGGSGPQGWWRTGEEPSLPRTSWNRAAAAAGENSCTHWI